MGARAVGAAVVASLAVAPFIPTWGSLALGALIGLITPIAIFVCDRLLRWDDPTAALTVHGLGGLLGIAAVGVLADGTAGAGWNGIGADEYLGVAGQGVTGLLAAEGLRADFPLQLQAQLVGGASLALFAFFAAWLFLAPLATTVLALRPRAAGRATSAVIEGEGASAAGHPGPEPGATMKADGTPSEDRSSVFELPGPA
jgi:Amt family ammonium transporter